ncbi:hypothetical protein CONLIGDRAFT_637162 [Coniochaeta ligniaria NRRL 30616]|uniref:Ecp2 effector protein-like domain-containing protein n=1 Tax=Coniochaeta ligniaria NRRL 30616 TaxID=1408157 RepID=A0A1J7I8Z4_9PEZI|nr:hypothetical protein CONLIGDRAFT_637162 [Coniochaeta ligniaria NRRL 30616]
MSSIAKAKAVMALLLAARLTSAAAIPTMGPNPATTIVMADTAGTGNSTMTTTPAVWPEAKSGTNALAPQDDDAWLLETSKSSAHQGDSCGAITYPVANTTKTIMLCPALPTDSEGRCGYTWDVQGMTDVDSPLAGDCIKLAQRIRGAGEWKVESIYGNHHQLVEYRTCAFGVMGIQFAYNFNLGNQDIIDLLRDSVRDFTVDGKVAASGKMQCVGRFAKSVWVEWGIYRQPGW